jgi:hemolysin activation/secretion protein
MISGPSEKNSLGDYLVGGFVGLKGAWAEFSYNLFYAKDLRSPKDFEVKGSTMGASLNYVLN